MSFVLRIALLLVTFTVASAAETRLTGRVSANDGRPLMMAHLQIMTEQGTTVVQIGKEGRFSTSVDQLGGVRLFFSGADHQPYIIHLYLERPDVIDLDLRLAAHQYETTFDQVAAVGTFNGYDWNTAVHLHPESDGRWIVDLPSTTDSVGYQHIPGSADTTVCRSCPFSY